MQWLTRETVAKTYLITILTIGMTVSPLPQFMLATALVILQLYIIYKPSTAKTNIALMIGTLILAPLVLTPLTGYILSSLSVIPSLYLLDKNLRESAQIQTPQTQKKTRQATEILKSTSAALVLILVISLATSSWETVFTSSIITVYIITVLSYSIHNIPKKPFKETKTWSRVLVGKTERKTITIFPQTNLQLRTIITPVQPWVKAQPSILKVMLKAKAEADLVYTPSLAGPTKVQLQTSTLDPWGLIQTNQTLKPLELHVIPQAKYAEWLGKKTLEYTSGASAVSNNSMLPIQARVAKAGAEYYGSRPYQPGDRLKEVNWKRTFYVGELITKEFAGANAQPVIIEADLTVSDSKEANKLAYNIMMTALTCLTQAIPTGTAIYGKDGVVAVTMHTNPRFTLKYALKVTRKIDITQQPLRILHPIETYPLKRAILGLDKISQGIATKNFAETLRLECTALKTSTMQQPAMTALNLAINRTNPPAIIALTSPVSNHSEALVLALEKAKKRGYNIVKVST